ncbi:MAG: alcohol dehydrogenase catalytic domain-containing protein [Aquihabitans sp.]
MRRVVCRAFDQPVEIEDGPDLVAADNQVVVNVEAAAANFVDGLLVTGRYQIKPPLPFTPGMEIAGRIVGTGDRVGGSLARPC